MKNLGVFLVLSAVLSANAFAVPTTSCSKRSLVLSGTKEAIVAGNLFGDSAKASQLDARGYLLVAVNQQTANYQTEIDGKPETVDVWTLNINDNSSEDGDWYTVTTYVKSQDPACVIVGQPQAKDNGPQDG